MIFYIGIFLFTISTIYFGYLIGHIIGYRRGCDDTIDNLKKVRIRK